MAPVDGRINQGSPAADFSKSNKKREDESDLGPRHCPLRQTPIPNHQIQGSRGGEDCKRPDQNWKNCQGERETIVKHAPVLQRTAVVPSLPTFEAPGTAMALPDFDVAQSAEKTSAVVAGNNRLLLWMIKATRLTDPKSRLSNRASLTSAQRREGKDLQQRIAGWTCEKISRVGEICRQNHIILLVYLLLLCLVFLNVWIVALALPELLRVFTGVETFVTQSPRSFFNTTSLAVCASLTYLICDPLLKAIYTLRCFQGDSLHSGEDLAAELRALPRLGPVLAMVIAFSWMAPLNGAPPPQSSPPPLSLSVEEMNQAIDAAMKEPRFSWRLPRQDEPVESKRHWPFLDGIDRFLRTTGHAIKNGIGAFFRWLDHLLSPRNLPEPDAARLQGWQMSSRGWMTALLVILGLGALSLVVQSMRQLRLRRIARKPLPVTSAKPNLTEENVTADLLPEDEWLLLAREHLGKGELRFALRAFFFAGLAHLGGRELLTLARHKSNRDYARELRRRASDRAPLLAAFGDNIAAVERVWYGAHEIDRADLERFEHNLDAIREC